MEKNNQTIGRETAKICPLKSILSGKYVLQEGWKPNYVSTVFGKISRINVIGAVVSIESSIRFLIDDGTSTMKVNDFSSLIEKNDLKVGDLVLIIARIREYENELCLVTEIINKDQISEKPDWFKFRKEYLEKMLEIAPNVELEEEPPEIETGETPEVIEFVTPTIEDVKETNSSDDIIDFIRKYDSTNGCPTEEVITKFKNSDPEDMINSLIAMGEIYEIKAGYLKVLE